MTWLLLAGAIVFEVTGTMSLRASEGFKKRAWIVPVVLSYLLAFTLLFLCLANGMPVGVAYGIWSACGVALTAVLAHLLFKEPFTWVMGLGIVAIAGGVLLIEIGAPH
ncbi:DMT family transporter [Microbacterium xanthum]|uniref:DMT family transporter n=1 Tax=Microbacterium xanthum TaxID=3079794 RepID=UPI002AD2BE7B|nr:MULTISPECIES: multidrug efflux SMR transporter [unclassified Microbacterium]MDZ8172323.1 multidrug efflux SMR transporter [Microbacterium sp. KSW-48]MDZ8201959.1 multidrug efflux SMR transporter [Microbacterium sp. SSW1-59]